MTKTPLQSALEAACAQAQLPTAKASDLILVQALDCQMNLARLCRTLERRMISEAESLYANESVAYGYSLREYGELCERFTTLRNVYSFLKHTEKSA